MASIRKAAQDVLDIARDGIGWIVLWKSGKGWTSEAFWPDDVDDNGNPTFDDFDMEDLLNIVKKDPGAIIVNSYIHNLGDTTCMTRDSLADFLRWQYNLQHSKVSDALAYCAN